MRIKELWLQMLKALIVMQFSSCQCHIKFINVYIDINVYDDDGLYPIVHM